MILMSDKRFFCIINKKGRNVIIDKECHIEIIDLTLVCEVLNRLDLKLKTYNEQLGEQQATIQRMKHSLNTIYKSFEKHYGYDMRNAIWLIDELSYDEMVDELHIAETDAKNRKESSMYWKKKCDEQQATIQQLQKEIEEWKKENRELLDQIQEFERIPKSIREQWVE